MGKEVNGAIEDKSSGKFRAEKKASLQPNRSEFLGEDASVCVEAVLDLLLRQLESQVSGYSVHLSDHSDCNYNVNSSLLSSLSTFLLLTSIGKNLD